MISLEQVKLLETKVARTIEYVKKVTGENVHLKGKLDSYQQRIDELEVLIKRFREDQSRIEDGILSALDRLNQFEDAVEKKLFPEGKTLQDKSGADETSVDEVESLDEEVSDPDSPDPKSGAGQTLNDEDIPPPNGELDIF